MTAYSDHDIVSRAEKTMPYAYVLKPYNNNQLKATINLAILNFNINKVSIQEDTENTTKLELLTSREKEVLITLATGKISKEIGEILNISTNTVEQHKKNIRKKIKFDYSRRVDQFYNVNKAFEVV